MRHLSVFILLFIAVSLTAQNSQNLKDLEKKRKATLAEIEETSKLLNENKKITSNALNRLDLLTRQISARREVIQLLDSEVKSLESEIESVELDIKSQERELTYKKDTYAESLRKIYSHKNDLDRLLFVLSADNFAQSYRRITYLKEYAKWQREQAEVIMEKQKKLKTDKENLEKRMQEKTLLAENRRKEEGKLVQEEVSKQQEVKNLKGEQKKLLADLDKKKKQANTLNQAIEKAIAEEVARAEREARLAAEAESKARAKAERELALKEAERKKSQDKDKGKGKENGKTEKTEKVETTEKEIPAKPEETRVAETKGGYAMTKEERTLSSNFANNRGLLPFPIKGTYKIVGHFGRQQHQDLKYVVTNNNGIDIQTTPGSKARAVFNGEVTKIFVVPGFNNNVIVRHGNYLTVYSYLDEVYVKQGDKISTGQNLGRVFTDSESGNTTVLHFEVWKERDKLDPESWLDK